MIFHKALKEVFFFSYLKFYISLKLIHKSLWETQDVGLQHFWELLSCNLKPAPQAGDKKDEEKRQTTPDWKVAGLISKGTYLSGLSCVAARWILFCMCCQILKVYIEVLTGFSHIHNRQSHYHIAISRLYSWSSSWEKRRQVEYTFQGREGVGSLQLPWSSLWVRLVVMSS